MNLVNLQWFVEVVRRGSFAAVARDHGSAASSVSRAIQSLEEELGIRLFQRSTRRLELTEVGRQYFESVEGLIEALKKAADQATELSDTPSGTLRITAPVTFGQIGIVPLLPVFTEQYPELDIELLLTDHQLDLLAERIDVAVRLGGLSDSSYVATRLCAEPFVICASTEYLHRHGVPGEPVELAGHRCLRLPMADYAKWRFRDSGGGIDEITVPGRIVISNALALKQCAMANMGITLLPRWVVQPELTRNELTALFTDYAVGAPEFEVPVWLLYPSRQYVPSKARVFMEFLRQAFRERLPWSR